jgi:hypothetical protein
MSRRDEYLAWLDERAASAALSVTDCVDSEDDGVASAWFGGRAKAFREAHDRLAREATSAPLSPRAQQWADAIVAADPGSMIWAADHQSSRQHGPACRVLAEAIRDPDLVAAINAAAKRLREGSDG